MESINKYATNTWDVIIVGCGAAGMISAICAARSGCSVLILEHMESSGKKILTTGNGKCNYTNLNQDLSFYRSECPDFVASILNQFSVKDTIHFFQKIGIFPKDKNGYVYPYSEQAASVLEAFLIELRSLNVKILHNIAIRNISDSNTGFLIDTKTGTYKSKSCILATGGKSAKKTGSDGSGYIYAKNLGHHIIEPSPALVQLISPEPFFKEIAGIRIHGSLRLYISDDFIMEESGEIQLTDYGISGIPVFQISRHVSRAILNKQTVYTTIDFFPQMENAQLFELLQQRFSMNDRTTLETGIGLFPAKLYPLFLKKAKLDGILQACDSKENERNRLVDMIKCFRIDISGTKSFDFSQVTAGGIDTREISSLTMGSTIVDGLFFAGEIVDVDGACGGYNLQWAWASGYVAGNNAANYIKKDK